jgi:uncharacterized protein (TIGR02145 family)
LPTRDEWDDLARAAGGTRQLDDKGFIRWGGAGIKLKSKTGWDRGFNGSDDLMFTARPGGSNGAFGDTFPGDGGFWWTATESKDDRVYSRTLSAMGDDMYETDKCHLPWHLVRQNKKVNVKQNSFCPTFIRLSAPSLARRIYPQRGKEQESLALILVTDTLA